MKKITITAPEGKVINFDQEKGTVVFEDEPKSVIERIKTFEDVLKELEINHLNFLKDLEGLSSDEVAYRKIKLIAKAYNEQWIPDWTNSSERKYYPWFDMGSPSGVGFSYGDYDSWRAFSAVGSRLCFKTAELAEHAGKLFIDEYRDFLTLNIE
ncbi:hypothetical protein [Flavobacterium sp.]|uniref:hypothetical protein n=1 Tax=Flavobacterium sp. TaxID=239 RepID=UPI002622E706|nr:hypothetical protein [Flavobacterium sp.]